MKKFISLASACLGRVGFYFLLVILVFAMIAAVTGYATINVALVWSALLFGALLGLSDGVYTLKFLGSYAVKAIVHTVLAVLSFALSFVLVSGVIETGKSAVWSIFLFGCLAALITVIRGIIHMVCAKKENETKTYDYLYTPKN